MNRAELKRRAKASLKKYYWLAVGAGLLALLLGGAGVGEQAASRGITYRRQITEFGEWFSYGIRGPLLGILFGIMLLSLLIILCFTIFVSFPITIGYNYFFLRAAKDDVQFSYLFSRFNKGVYISGIKTLLLKNIYVFLWSLLFIIPGIVKSYEYRFTEYIIAEEPKLTAKEAIARSSEMTKGHKWEMFVLDLSFILWNILANVLIIGQVFLRPYIEATFAQYYFELKNEEGNYNIEYYN